MSNWPNATRAAVERRQHTAALSKNMLLGSWPTDPLLWPCSLPCRGWQALQLSAHSCSQAERRPIHKPSAKHPAPCPLLHTFDHWASKSSALGVRRTHPVQHTVYLSKIGLNVHLLHLSSQMWFPSCGVICVWVHIRLRLVKKKKNSFNNLYFSLTTHVNNKNNRVPSDNRAAGSMTTKQKSSSWTQWLCDSDCTHPSRANIWLPDCSYSSSL